MFIGDSVPNMQRGDTRLSRKLKISLSSEFRASLFFFALVMSFFVLYSFPVLSSASSVSHFVDSPSGFSNDKTSAIQMVYWYQNMSSPWDLNKLINYPIGEGSLQWQSLTQAVQVYVLFFGSKFLSAKMVVLIIIGLGSYLTALGSYMLAKVVGLSLGYRFAAGLMTLLLPMWQVGMASHTSAVYFGLPILNLSLFMIALKSSRLISALVFTFFLGFTALLDGYWIVYTLIAISSYLAISFFMNPKLNNLKNKLHTPPVGIYMTFASLFVLSAVGISFFSGRDSVSRPLGVTSIEILNVHGITIQNLVNRTTSIYSEGEFISGYNAFYFGNVFFVASIVMFFMSKQVLTRLEVKLLIIAVFFLLMASKPEVSTLLGNTFGFSSFTRFITPGVVHNYRATSVSFMIILVIGLVVLQRFMRTAQASPPFRSILGINFRYFRSLFVIILALMVWIDWNPLGSRFVSQDDVRLEPISFELAGQPTVFFPETLHGRNWLQQGVLRAPMVNGNRSNASISRFKNALQAGDEELYVLMKNNGVKNLVVDYRNNVPFFVSKVDKGALRRHPDPDLFQYVTQVHMPSYESRFVTLHLYKLK